MSTAEEVRTAWATHLWQDDTVQVITPQIHDYDILAQSQKEVTKFYAESDGGMIVNFFTYVVQRAQDPGLGGQIEQTFRVEVNYYLQQTDIAGENYNLVEDRLGTVDDLVYTVLGATWRQTVDFFNGGEPRRIEAVTLDGKSCWRGGLTFQATKKI